MSDVIAPFLLLFFGVVLLVTERDPVGADALQSLREGAAVTALRGGEGPKPAEAVQGEERTAI